MCPVNSGILLSWLRSLFPFSTFSLFAIEFEWDSVWSNSTLFVYECTNKLVTCWILWLFKHRFHIHIHIENRDKMNRNVNHLFLTFIITSGRARDVYAIKIYILHESKYFSLLNVVTTNSEWMINDFWWFFQVFEILFCLNRVYRCVITWKWNIVQMFFSFQEGAGSFTLTPFFYLLKFHQAFWELRREYLKIN